MLVLGRRITTHDGDVDVLAEEELFEQPPPVSVANEDDESLP